MKVSILIAVYNAERWLREALESALWQSHGDVEVLCVDDCSTDSSLAILEEYVQRDGRVSIWKQERNYGQAVARNVALQHSTGDVVMFLDADDWLSQDAVEQVVKVFAAHTDTGCVLFQCRYVHPDGSEEAYQQPSFGEMGDGSGALSGYEAFVKSLTWQIHGIYAVRGDLHRAHPYDTTCRHFSDDNTTRIHYYMSREVRECSGVYYYRMNAASVTHAVTLSRLDYLTANLSMRRQLIDLGCPQRDIDLYENHRWLNLLGTWLWYARHRNTTSNGAKVFTKEQQREAIRRFREAWESIDSAALTARNSMKPGYFTLKSRWIPTKTSWKLFRFQLETFALARRILNR